jgi:hypothetical protein
MEAVLCCCELATAKSSFPSPLKSPTATEEGPGPAATDEASVKFPVPSPNKMETVLSLELTTARSCLPSPLKSATASELGILPAAGEEAKGAVPQ